MAHKNEPDFSDEEIAARRDAAILRALTTPPRTQESEPKPRSAKAEGQRKRREREKAAFSAAPSLGYRAGR